MPPRGRMPSGVRALGPTVPGALGENISVESEKENILVGPLSGTNEFEHLTRKLKTLTVEKDNALKILQAREAELKLKSDEEQRLQTLLNEKEEKQRKLVQKLRKLEKGKEFRPTINVPVSSCASSGSQDSIKKNRAKNDKVKKPLSPFMMWCKEHRHQVKKENPEASFTALKKLLREKWKTVPVEDQAPFIERYETEKEIYQKLSKEKRETEAMKLFQDEEIKKTAFELLEQYLQFKKKLKAAEDQDEERAKVEEAQALQLLKQKKEIDQVKKTLKVEKLKKKAKAPVDSNKPKKPSTSYVLFTKENRSLFQQQKPGASYSEINATLAIKWQEMSDEEKQVWEDKAKEARDQYNTALEEFNRKKQEVTPVATSQIEEESKD
ncbi:hypothetical protein R1flu_010443 [Riccia fluitans]|uniref:HMG box domain-containing protein n=1 Tax=Riccia fluitans TaxID=41844 RepID=A0ABD1Z5B6_9MARC